MKKVIRVGTRKSPLAMKQTKLVVTDLQQVFPELAFEVVELGTKGDRDKQTALSQFGKEGIFTDEIGQAIKSGTIDFAVHSLKDLPTVLTEGLILASHPKRENPFDSLIMRTATSLETLPVGAVIGTSSLRREIELLRLRPDVTPVSIRGNIDQRLAQLAKGDFDGIILANAGLNRLGWQNHEGFSLVSFDQERFIPSVGQGILGLECRKGDHYIQRILASVADPETMSCAAAERAFLLGMSTLEANQTSAAYAHVQGDEIVLTVMRGSRQPGDYQRNVYKGKDGHALGLAAAQGMRKLDD
ncbi:hydroxymethylbilane synthase [Vagococcus sp. BWB3-3]|uniref:Hydroxymethylbilane synthase n=1 Tax=Vagococcus allomyrinae TaxID=2794353 RepID=A0A940PDU2_9ENTE|nr:hydroxymethylbilane synthase [Vagococcus allomyrinae]